MGAQNRPVQKLVQVWMLGLAIALVASSVAAKDLSPELRKAIKALGLTKTLQPRSIVPRIVGGSEAMPDDFPFIVSLRFPEGFSSGSVTPGDHYCGGVLIAKNIVLTAGHCVNNPAFKNLEVHIGRYEREGDDEGRYERMTTIETRIFPEFVSSDGWVNHDIALLVLDGESTKELAEFAADEELAGSVSVATVLGWGYTDPNTFSLSERLHKLEVPVVSRDSCRALFGSDIVITEYMVCAGEEGKDACLLDSGGPLLLGRTVGGVVSWGRGCATKEPGVYASVGAAAQWIRTQIEDINKQTTPTTPPPEPSPVIPPPVPSPVVPPPEPSPVTQPPEPSPATPPLESSPATPPPEPSTTTPPPEPTPITQPPSASESPPDRTTARPDCIFRGGKWIGPSCD